MPPPKNETDEQKAIRLTKAKKNASKAREEAMVAKYKDKVLAKEKEKQKQNESDEEEDEESEDEEVPKKPLKPIKPIKEEIKEEKPKAKPKPKSKAKIIIEQSESDEDTFEPSKDVIFVKRVRAKQTSNVPYNPNPRPPTAPTPTPQQYTPPPTPQLTTRQPIPITPKAVPQPALTQQQRIEIERYNAMSRGQFLPSSKPR
jgi:hypothetical protein